MQQAPTPAEPHLLLKDQGGLLRVPHRVIRYVEGCKDYVKIVASTKTYLHFATLEEIADLLGKSFGRAHRSYLVAVAHVRLLQPTQVLLADGTAISIGSSYKPELLAWFRK